MKETEFNTKESASDDDVISFYDSYANTWDARFDHSYSTDYFIRRRWDSFLNIFRQNKITARTGLELGVGTGVYISELSKLFNRLIAVDGSANMLEVLNKKLADEQITNVTVIQSNVISIKNIEDATVECIFFFGLIEHIIDIDKFVKELHRILKAGGVVIGVTPNGRSPWYKFRNFIRGTGKHCSTDKYFTLSELNSLFNSNGFNSSSYMHWGAVPAGIGNGISKILAKLEPLLEKTPLNCYLGGLTFSFVKS